MTDGNETRRSNTIASIRLDGGFASASPDNREVDLSWTAYNGWNLPEYVVQVFDYKNPGSGWVVAAGPTTDTFVRYERPRPKGKYALRIRTTSPDGSLRSYSNPIDFDMPSRPVEIPNVITPNGDNLNDVLVIENLDYYPGAVFRVFNRWGQKVFESSDYQNNFGGDELESGSYFYELIISEDGQQQQFKGTMRIMRG
jgi:gliding motility-associated-like protein